MPYRHPDRDAAGFQTQRILLDRLGIEGPQVFDVGGNVGQSVAQYLRLFPGATVHSFEPHPACFEQLRGSYGSHGQVRCEAIALGCEAGETTLYAARRPEVSSLLPPEPFVMKRSAQGNYDYQEVKVHVDTLDRYVLAHAIGHIHILKIDVQGGELQVLRGAAGMLARRAIDVLFLEVLFAENYRNQCYFDDIWRQLRTHAYVLWDLFPFLYTDSGRLWTGNALFVSPECKERLDPCFANARNQGDTGSASASLPVQQGGTGRASGTLP
jgi:FkbM family methyltransferase